MFFAQPGSDQLARKVPLAEQQGVELHRLTEREASARFPSFRVTPGAEAVFLPRGGMLDADACVAAFQAGARAGGAELLPETAVEALDVGSTARSFGPPAGPSAHGT